MTDAPNSLTDVRRRKDAHFASGRGPLRGAALETFTGLNYYPPDPALVFRLPLERSSGAEVTLQTTSGELRQMQEFGAVLVPFEDAESTLTLYAQPGEEAPRSLFLPFRDAGSGSESYGAGRYLDVPTFEGEGGLWVSLDFNLAYHPYCAYGDGWTCPLPPAGNWLQTVVRAGERLH
ncbi:DUF1684 domain-containing protein [Deinococcus radiomollis]|uniref:DUF1684 domain-containing protein n=1 Tax=Deinococcus radiomollis TaxID=468916 RepID=UPI00389173E2